MLSEAAIAAFKSSLRGEVISPSDSSYDAARSVYNAMISRHPRLIARCADVVDVMAAVKFGREQGLLTAIRGGGHNAGSLGVCDDGLVIDLSPMDYRPCGAPEEDRVGRRWRVVASCGSRHAPVRSGGSIRNYFDDRRRWIDLGRRDRLLDATIRPDH